MIISFAWTTDALLVGRKTCTRRDWNPIYAARFLAGTVHDAYDRLPRTGKGHKVGKVQIEKPPYIERTRDIPDADFEAEGLKFMEEKGILIRGITPRAWFDNWRSSDQVLFVVRFRLVFPCDRCGEWTTAPALELKDVNIRLCALCSVDWSYYADDHSRRATKSQEEFIKVYREFCATPRAAERKVL